MSEEINDIALETLIGETIYVIDEPQEIYIVFSQSLKFEGSKESAFLASVLSAVKLDYSKVKLVNIHNDKFTPKEEGVYLLFGINPYEAGFKGLDTLKYEVYEKEDLLILEADKLNEISLDVNKKKALWGGMKRLFNA